ncbi:hypothetical protein ABEO92_10735 [Geobacillus stearothermophilus]|uniref:Uncharacterized protein n=2 Tax=Geobacillus TaxID=129337 RepID=A0A7U9J9C4_GEOTM|nr:MULTISPECIES: hypothetical protein [Geobacillus]ESU71171.1 hypothetical protein T260_15015 [Geobacillus sp. MAS1]
MMLQITLPPISEDDALELQVYISCGESVFGQPESQTLREFIDFLYKKCREIEAERWRNDPQSWGACSKWPYEDDLPF